MRKSRFTEAPGFPLNAQPFSATQDCFSAEFNKSNARYVFVNETLRICYEHSLTFCEAILTIQLACHWISRFAYASEPNP